MIILDMIISSLQINGGISVYFNNIIELLAKNKIEFSEITTKNPTHKIGGNRAFERYRNCKTNQKSGVFHSSYYRLPTSKNLKIVTTTHDFTYEKFITGPAQWIHSWQKNRAIRNSDIVICVSHNTAVDLMQYCPIDDSRIRVIHNGVSDAYYPLPNLGTSQSNTTVLFVGARGGYKNFMLAIEAVASIPDLTLGIVGGGALTNNELHQLEQHLPGRYQWLGRLSDEELNMAYNRAHSLLYPSSYEGFGIPVIEAMRAGCPVIAVNASSIAEVAGNAALLVEKPSVKMFSEALTSISSSREFLIQKGFMQASKFSWDRCFQETLSVYKELM